MILEFQRRKERNVGSGRRLGFAGIMTIGVQIRKPPPLGPHSFIIDLGYSWLLKRKHKIKREIKLVTECGLNETTQAQVLLDNNIYKLLAQGNISTSGTKEHTIDSGHDEANLGSVSGTRKVCVDLLVLVLVEADEAVQDVVAGSGVVVTTLVVGEVVLHGADGKLLLEAIDLVEEENDGCLCKPS